MADDKFDVETAQAGEAPLATDAAFTEPPLTTDAPPHGEPVATSTAPLSREEQRSDDLPALITVRTARPGQVGAWEKHPAHPGGEAFVGGTGEEEVAATPFILRRIREHSLVLVDGPEVAADMEEAEKAGTAYAQLQVEAQEKVRQRTRLEEEAGDLRMAAVWHDVQAAASTPAEQSAAHATSARERADAALKEAAEL